MIQFIDPCLSPFDLKSKQTANPAADNFSGNPIIVQLTEFTVQPSTCQVTYSCTDISRVDGTLSELTCGDITVTSNGQVEVTANSASYLSGKITPGVYVIEITGTSGSDTPKSDKTTIEFEFSDPCDPPVSITEPVF